LTWQEALRLCETALRNVNMDSTPGFPLNQIAGTNAKLLEDQGFYNLVIEESARRLLALSRCDESDMHDYCIDPMKYVISGHCDPLSPFLKDEPHPSRKVKEGRYRNVWACGLVDQVVNKVLLSGWPTDVKDKFPTSPILYGLGTSDDLNSQVFGEYQKRVRQYGFAPVKSDVRNWDGHFSWVAGLMFFRVVSLLYHQGCGKPPPDWWLRAFKMHLLTCIHCVFQCGDGILYAKIRLGLMPSGTGFTTLGNSVARIAAALAAGSVGFFVLGDDYEWNRQSVGELTATYKKLGLELREAEKCSADKFIVCSHEYVGGGRAALTGWPRACFKLGTSKFSRESFVGVKHAMRHCDAYAQLALVLVTLDNLLRQGVDQAPVHNGEEERNHHTGHCNQGPKAKDGAPQQAACREL